jgi:hypothetical protein
MKKASQSCAGADWRILNAVFDKITMAYFDRSVFSRLWASTATATCDPARRQILGEFYGRTMACIAQVSTEFEARFAELSG